MFKDEQTKALAAPLHKENVKRNPRGFDYVESWHAEAEANRIFGFDGWSSVLLDHKCVMEKARKLGSGNNQYDGWGVTYTATVRVTAGGVDRDGAGAGHGMDKDLGLAHESALKEAASDAEKRALKTFGNQFGLALYDKSRENVIAAPVDDGKVINPATGRKIDPMSPNQARLDGRGVKYDALIHELDAIIEVTECIDWGHRNVALINTFPKKWQDDIQAHYDNHIAELRTIIARESGADEETGEMVA